MKNAELKKVKIYKGMSQETTAFNAELWIDKKLAAHVENDGHGGCNFIRYVDRNHGKSAYETAFNAWTEAMPPVPCTDDWAIERGFGPMAMDAEFWVSLEVERVASEQDWKRKCARNTLIRLVGDSPDQFRAYKPAAKYSPEFAAQIKAKHGANLLEIINERFINV